MSATPRLASVLALAAWTAACSRGPAPSAADGRLLYEENGCITCHGATGHGDGRISSTLNPPPRDFRDVSAFKNGTDESAIAATLAEGVSAGSDKMPRFVHLTEWERRSLALFVISLRTTAASADGPGQP